MASYATGRARLTPDYGIVIDLYHHTTGAAKSDILKSRLLRGSAWNIQGNRTLENVAYAYLTPLNRITAKEDLYEIAMASDGILRFQRDNVVVPDVISTQWLENHRQDVLELTVYRESTKNRQGTLRFMVDAAILAPQHLVMHAPWGRIMYYEVNNPMIHRIGVRPTSGVRFNAAGMISEQPDLKRFQYLVLGNATTLAGLAAPYDEENTDQIYKIEFLEDGMDPLTFWMENANRDHFSGKQIELQRFKPAEAGQQHHPKSRRGSEFGPVRFAAGKWNPN